MVGPPERQGWAFLPRGWPTQALASPFRGQLAPMPISPICAILVLLVADEGVKRLTRRAYFNAG
jgi:hypothetical protein